MPATTKTSAREIVRVTYPSGLVVKFDATAWDAVELADWITYALVNGITVEEVSA